MTRRTCAAFALALAVTCTASLVRGEHTQKWLTRSEADFNQGEFRNLVLTNTGELRLSRELKNLLADDAQVETVSALAEGADGTLYAAVGGTQSCRVIAVQGGKSRTVRSFSQDAQIYAILVDAKGRLLIGLSGEKASVLRVSAAELAKDPAGEAGAAATQPGAKDEVVFADDESQYVWALAFSPDGDLLIATGPDGKLFTSKAATLAGELSTDPAAPAACEVLYDAEAANLTSMVVAKDGTIYLGSDPNGLVYKFDPKTKQATVLLDATEPEITALALDANGNLYVAAGAASAQGGGSSEPAEHMHRGLPDLLGPEKRDPDLPEPPMTPPEAQPKEGAKEGANEGAKKEPSASLFSAHLKSSRFRAAPPNPALPLSIPEHLLKLAAGSSETHSSEGPGEGSAVYRIDPEGLVTEVFRTPATIYTLAERNGSLLIATGGGSEEKPEGLLYELNLRKEESGQIARASGKDISVLLPLKDGSVAVGISNGGAIATLSAGLAAEGVYLSDHFDATASARLGMLRLEGSLPAGAGLTVSTRSGNTAEPSDAGWSKWSPEMPATHFAKIASPAGRYFQYRLTFKAAGAAAVGSSATLREVEASYLIPNVAPKFQSFDVSGSTTAAAMIDAPTSDSAGHAVVNVSWEATDANKDTLEYTLQYRPVGLTGAADADEWRPLKDKLTTTTFAWDTRGVPDGRYQLRITASDAADNAATSAKTTSRISEVLLVDNTPPVIAKPTVAVNGKEATVSFSASDIAGTIARLAYRLDSEDTWHAVAPVDKLLDSPAEDVVLKLPDLTPGKHHLQVQAVDDKGNAGFALVTVDVAK